ncbi:hypothetical protein [Pueribacillus theae]|uniref:hypothetical protein n=1 Tax=Pueribacillus theae TaxID=2171751 RepID=UPI00140220A1|nr:hypothetical protein [Pueribacillus theae]
MAKDREQQNKIQPVNRNHRSDANNKSLIAIGIGVIVVLVGVLIFMVSMLV